MRPLWLLGFAACGRLEFDPIGLTADASDASNRDAPAACSTFGAWSVPAQVTSLTSATNDWEPALHPDGNLLVFSRDGQGLFSSMRTGPSTFSVPTLIGVTDDRDQGPAWSGTGDRLYFTSQRNGAFRLWYSDYSNGVFQPITTVSDLAAQYMLAPAVRFDDLELYWCTGTPGSVIERAERTTSSSPWAVTGPEPQLTLPGGQSGWPTLSADGLTMYLEGIDATGPKLYVSTRASLGQRFGVPTLVSDLNVSDQDDIGDPELSRDGLTLLSSFQPQAMPSLFDIYISTRVCLD